MTHLATKKRVVKTSSTSLQEPSALPTLMDHLHELQGRLFSTVLVFILIAGAAYPFFDKIAGWLMAPLRKDQELVYLTPGGAFSFIIKVCVYVGVIGALPVIVFHLYRFIMPAVKKVHIQSVLKYTIASFLLAVAGILFAYYVSLPASLYFLTGFSLNHIDPMLTIDSYFSFVMTYMLAGALLFQMPLVMLIINSVTPLTPKKLMSFQRHMLVISFIIAAVISPTPDALNQILLASPLVVMYQVGIILIWRVNRRRNRREATTMERRQSAAKEATVVPAKPAQAAAPVPLVTMHAAIAEMAAVQQQGSVSAPVKPRARRPNTMDMVVQGRPNKMSVPARPATMAPQRTLPVRPVAVKPVSPLRGMGMQSLDGVVRMQRAT